MIKMFKLNGQVYCKIYAWTPVRTSGDREWIWLNYYYVRLSRGRELYIMNEQDFQTDYNRFS